MIDRAGPPTAARRSAAALALALLVASCTNAESATTEAPTTSSTTSTTTTLATTTTEPPTTTTAPIVPVIVSGDFPLPIAVAVSEALTAIRDPRAEGPITDDVAAHHADGVALEDGYEATATTATLADGAEVGVVTLGNGDLVVIADDGDGWTVVGTHLAAAGEDPHYGESPRRVLVLGSDARPGGDPLVHRMDSIHILTSSPADRSGTILGYPRDTWIDSPYGSMRINALTSSSRGPDAIFEHFTDAWDLPLEGWIVTGFAGFEDLVAATLGRIELVIPIPIPTQEWFAGFSAGEQSLDPTRTLDFARTRKLIPGGDFTRSYHQGIVMLAALTMIQRGTVHDLPGLVATLTEHTTTDLTPADLIQLAVAAYEMDIGSVTNEVLPGSLGRAGGGASVVFLDDGWERIVDDVIDDGLRNSSAP